MDYKKDYYSILGVDEKATREQLRDSYRRLAKLHHPDKNPGDQEAVERFKTINEAYEILSNEITRHVYDSYRANNKKEAPANHKDNNDSDPTYKPFTREKTRSQVVKKEKRVYVHGHIEVKFQGDPEIFDTYIRQWEQRYTIIPTEVLATITSTAIYRDRPPKEYDKGYSTAELFKTPLKQPVNCRIISENQEKYYQLDLYSIRIKDIRLKDITRHEQYSFGTLQGTFYGHVLYQFEEEITEKYTECYGATGQVETKTEAGYIYTRQQFYKEDCSTDWTEWTRDPVSSVKYHTRRWRTTSSTGGDYKIRSDWTWLILPLIIIGIWPKLLLVIIPLIAWLTLIFFSGWIISAFSRMLPWLGGLTIVLIILAAARSFFHQPVNNSRYTSGRNVDTVYTEKTITKSKDNKPDTLITHTLTWEDRDSARYTIRLAISTAALQHSSAAHNQMEYQQYVMQDIGAVYRFMLETDDSYLKPVAAAFDSLAKAKALDRRQTASMIVSCIQSIPYSLVVDGSCSNNNNEDFVRQYLAQCENDCCKGYSKFGVQSPVEFIGDLKGDCDTRALLLYDVLRRLGYKVALMTSNYYKHAVIAVHIDAMKSDKATVVHIDGETYYLWETTSKGFGPGEIPRSLSNMNYWNISLIQ